MTICQSVQCLSERHQYCLQMSAWLPSLPFDVLFEISTNLNLDDVIHLSLTCHQLRAIILNDTLAFQVVEASDNDLTRTYIPDKLPQGNHAYSDEARQARRGTITYGDALCAIYDRRHAFSSVQPFSVRNIGPILGGSFLASSILYREGVLCAQSGHLIRVVNLRSPTAVVELDLYNLIEANNGGTKVGSYEMMYYSDGILSVHVVYVEVEMPSNIFCIRTTVGVEDSERNLGFVFLEGGCSKLFVRHTAEYLYFGTHTGEGSDGHRKWEINGCPISTMGDKQGCHFPPIHLEANLLLDGFHGNDVGSTVAFEIHDGFFYAVSNQGTYEVEEVDWTSFYHCIRFPLDKPIDEALQKNTRVYRRQHAQGAIHDSWTDLTLQHDERTNDLFIVESRREWIGASSRQARTFYTSRIKFGTPASTDSSWDFGCSSNDITVPRPLPDNDIMTTVLESSHSANYMPTPRQYSWAQHPEFPYMGSEVPPPRSFILARTKFRSYNYSCSAFLDLVEDGSCCPNRSPASMPCLRLRIGSRRIAPAGYGTHGYEDCSTVDKYSLAPGSPTGGRVHFEDDTQYRYSQIRLWPPPPSRSCSCSQRIHDIMNPVSRQTSGMGSGQKRITAICDERSIVYLIKPSLPITYDNGDGSKLGDELSQLVLIDFGRTPIPSGALLDNDQWYWTPGQEKRCRTGTCC